MIAVFLVVFYHFGFQGVPGEHGVLAFFVLSGFLITWLLLREEERFGSISLKLFYARRSLRIFPAFYFYWLLLTGYLLLRDKPIVWGQTLSSLFYVNNYYQAMLGDPGTSYSHTWSLGIEEQFYLIWPFCFIALGFARRRIAFLLLLIAGLWTYRGILEYLSPANQGYIYEAFDTRADHLGVGCLLALLLYRGLLGGLWRRLCTVTMSLVTLALLAASVALYQTYGWPYRDVVGFAVDPLLIAVLIVQVISLRHSPLWSWLNLRWIAYFGALSYSIYLYHQVGGGLGEKIFASYDLGTPMVGAIVMLIVVAAASYHLVEQPFLRLKRLASRPATVPPPYSGLGTGDAPIPKPGQEAEEWL
jgi:peptidoglycan/LPS O-acetylase OafA/YrhL